MKIAICFSGGIRSFKTCYPSIYKYLLQPLHPDIFIHAWSYGRDMQKYKKDKNIDVTYKIQPDECKSEFVIDKLQPKKFVIDVYNAKWERKIMKPAETW